MLIFLDITSILLSITVWIIFQFKFINDGLIIFKISTVGLSEIIYLIIISIYVAKNVRLWISI